MCNGKSWKFSETRGKKLLPKVNPSKEKQKFLTQPMANLFHLLGIAYLIGKIKLKLVFHGALAE